MMDFKISSNLFPSFDGSERASWAPLILEPISGSYERLVVGVAAFNDGGFHVEIANRLDRLRCLYGDNAESIIVAIQISNEALKHDLSKRAAEAILDPYPAITGFNIGECREAEGRSLEQIAKSWFSALSSLYCAPVAETEIDTVVAMDAAETKGGGDRLPALVLAYVRHQKGSYEKFFSADLRAGKMRRMRGRSHEVMIDFAGSRLVANFGTLKANSLSSSVNLIKRRLWDLKVERDRDTDTVISRAHEMLIQKPNRDDPQVTEKQLGNVAEALEALEAQADQEDLRLEAFESVSAIGDRIIRAEAA